MFSGTSKNVQQGRVTQCKTKKSALTNVKFVKPAAPRPSKSGSSFCKCVMPLFLCLELLHRPTLNNAVCVQLCLFSLDITDLQTDSE